MESIEQRWVVDSVDDDRVTVRVDGQRALELPVWLLPMSAKEGDVLTVRHELDGERATVCMELDRAATAEAYRRSFDRNGATG